ncbi:hypothetical protein QF030_000645 [Streptomyces rishiriensis]|uniref:Uncharacterized protein n=1 Tax=Streptomyces rishiriensis TaxID=68264 RepID=A0ABU0NH69_STRRH|nr:hypothetical protein [Streptomyces rishiriensis]
MVADQYTAAHAVGISQRTVERYIKDQIRRSRADLAQRLEDAVRARWQPRVRELARRQAATTTGLVITSGRGSAIPPRPAPPPTLASGTSPGPCLRRTRPASSARTTLASASSSCA